jgi:hydroxyacylglutathione hydrolase
MRQLAPDVHLLRGFPPNAINVYLVGDVLIDAATRQGEKRIMRQIAGHTVTAHALTHAHPDHQGASHAICERLEIPLWCGVGDVPAMETPGAIKNSQAPGWLNRLQERYWTGPAHPVARALREGDEVAGFTVLETPGHSRGHVTYWREADRVLILGDVLNNMNVKTGVPGLHEPPRIFTPDPERNRQSIRRLAALRPSLVCFGHGAPLRDGQALERFVSQLPA